MVRSVTVADPESSNLKTELYGLARQRGGLKPWWYVDKTPGNAKGRRSVVDALHTTINDADQA